MLVGAYHELVQFWIKICIFKESISIKSKCHDEDYSGRNQYD